MKDIEHLGGVPVVLERKGEKDVGKGSKMKTFMIAKKKGAVGAQLTVSSDHRKVSREASFSYFAFARLPTASVPQQQTDDFPF